MAPPSDRTLRINKRSFDKIRQEIETLLSKKMSSEVMNQIEILNDSSLKPTVEKFEEATMDLLLLIDEKSSDDLELENRVLKDQSEVRGSNAMLQAKIIAKATALRGEEMRKSIVPNANSTLAEARSGHEQPKLKKIEIPEFDGDLSKFFNFKALFINLVHNNSEFSNVQKLFYLKQALVGKAAIVLQDCDLAEDAYPEAWAYFLNRYESRRAIVRNFFLKLSTLQAIRNESGIRDMLDQTMAIIRGLKVAGETVNETFSRYISFLVSSKLDSITAKDWDNHTCEASTYPKFEDLFKFLQGRTFVIDERQIERPKERDVNRNVMAKKSFLATGASNGKCLMCNGQHFLNQCDTFKAGNAHRRYEFVKANRLCIICFSKDHTAASCNSKFKCRCGKPHHNLLHFEFKIDSSKVGVKGDNGVATKDSNNLEKDIPKQTFTGIVQVRQAVEKVVLLPTALVRWSCGNTDGTARILLDSCAQATMISDKFIRKYRIPAEKTSCGSRLGGIVPGFVSSNQVVCLTLVSRTQQFTIDIEAEVVPPTSIAYEVFAEIPKEEVNKLSRLQLADPAIAKMPVRINDVDIIIGAEYYEKCSEANMMEVNGLFLRLSKFGWTVSGPCKKTVRSFCGLVSKWSGVTINAVETELKKYHKTESCIKSKPKVEVTDCLDHFQANYAIENDGKFSLRLPFKVEKSKVSSNRSLALVSLFRLERKLNPQLKADYVKFMREYIEMGHASLAKQIVNEPSYFIPHRAVVREESSTTPVRVVFNASSHTRGAISLNEALMLGPQTQRELFDILISVRSYRYVFLADVAKMYRMVWIDKRDRDMQRVLWRETPDDRIKEYQLNTVTYGTKPASFMATQCLGIIAKEIESIHPEAARMIRENFYMDDLIAGGDNLGELCSNRRIIHKALATRGFNLRKYCANSREILTDVPEDLVVNGSNVQLADDVAMLGVVWSPNDDEFHIKLNLQAEALPSKLTKRLVLSILARTFDPLGFVAPVCLRGKLLMQSLWQLGLNWDNELPETTAKEFSEYIIGLSEIQSLVIPRYVCWPGTRTQLIGFCDASAKAYCAMLFIRTLDSDVVKSCRLICAKTRVAPVKGMTIPKLELSSALLLAQLVDRVRATLKIELTNCFLFTDATIVLCWLSQAPDEWKTFVSNRVEKVQQLVPYSHWFYVNTSNNPADLATRGLPVHEFLKSPEWLVGPNFLKVVAICSNPIPNIDVSTALERRKVKTLIVNQVMVHEDLLGRFSNYARLLRILAYVLRFCDGARKRKINRNVFPSAFELESSLHCAIRIVQYMYFFEDINRLSNSLALKTSSKIISLTPFLDEYRILRVGGRLKHAGLSQAKKHPVILHARAHLVRVMVHWIHEKHFHANRRFMIAYLTARYWIVGGCSNLIKAVIRGCVRCTRHRGETASQLMGQLPPFRVQASRPFAYTGVDLAGPFQCKCVAHRSTRHYKIYMAIFVCMVVKCVHIEVVTDLSTSKFIEAFQRFIARRGAPSNMYSDNGTNFVGARNLMVFNQAEIESFVATEGITWSMIPPRSPHFGGLWESAVRSAKYHISRVLNGAVLSYDEYATLFTRVEAVLNSRPLCLSIEQGEEVLTPGHFLVGRALTSPPEIEADGHKLLSKRLAELNKRLRSFWIIWRADYLNQLQRRYKWQRVKPNVRVGQVVLVKDESPPYQWPLAVVHQVCPDPDGVVRVVSLKMSNSSNFLKRSVSKLILLPIDLHVDSPVNTFKPLVDSPKLSEPS